MQKSHDHLLGDKVMFQRENLVNPLQQIGVDPRSDVFDELAAAYGENHRHYHDQSHISECLTALTKYGHLAANPAEIAIAIWFHDAIYDTHRGDNEERSAEWARKYLLGEGANDTVVNRIAEMILATKTHKAEAGNALLMLDIDLGILGQPAQVFDAYDHAIRKEYCWVPEDQYRLGRAAVLRDFLTRPCIYHTEDFRSAFEQQARQNIEEKLNELIA